MKMEMDAISTELAWLVHLIIIHTASIETMSKNCFWLLVGFIHIELDWFCVSVNLVFDLHCIDETTITKVN